MAPVLVRTGRTLCPLPIEDHQRSRLLVCCVFQRPAQPQKPSVDAGWTLAFLVIYQRPMFLVSRLYIYIYIQYIFGVDTFDAQETFASVVFQSFKAEPS